MALTDPTCWMLRPPRRGSHAADFVAGGVVSFGWDWDVLGDLSAQPDQEIFQDLAAAGHTKPADDLRDLRIFTDRMGEGDVVVVMDHGAADLLFGEISGPYTYAAAAGLHRQTRPARWFGRLATSNVDELLVKAVTAGRHRIRKLPEQTRWQRLSGEVDDLLGRPATDVPTPPRVPPVRRRGGKRRTAAAPTRTVVPDRICASCGLLRAPSLFPDDEEYCRDCA